MQVGVANVFKNRNLNNMLFLFYKLYQASVWVLQNIFTKLFINPKLERFQCLKSTGAQLDPILLVHC